MKKKRTKTISLFLYCIWKINQLIYLILIYRRLKWVFFLWKIYYFHWFFVVHWTISCYQGGLNNWSTSQWAQFQFVLLVLWCWCWLVWHGSTSTRRSFAWISHSHSRLARRVFFSFPHFHALCGHKKKGTSHKKTLALEILLTVAVASLPLPFSLALLVGPQINSKEWREKQAVGGEETMWMKATQLAVRRGI